ncbi:hypothetical protein [Streptomyces sp. NPDC057253]|uniref:hypothetical protein n=1 Tax=Streptomyces sp. NPDC057253 TaxID=3346069 RepID=UPI0036424314
MVNNVGIKVVRGPSNGRAKIMKLGPDGTFPTLFGTSRGQAGPDHHLYKAARSTDAPAG